MELILILALLPVGILCQRSSHYLFGPSFGIRTYTGNKAIISSFETTLSAGAPTDPPQRRLAIWPGLDTTNGDLIQPIIVSSNEPMYTTYEACVKGQSLYLRFISGCANPGKGHWCVFASTLHNMRQITGRYAPLNPKDPLHILSMFDLI